MKSFCIIKIFFCLIVVNILGLNCSAYSNDSDSNYLDALNFFSANQSLLIRASDFFAKNAPKKLVDCGVLNVTTATLEFLKPNDLFFKGEVETITDYNVSFGKSGLVIYVAGVGDYIFSRIVDDAGKILREGVPVAVLDKSRLIEDVEMAKNRQKLAKMGHEYIKKLTEAQENLADKKIITPFEIESARIQLFANLMEYEITLKDTDMLIASSTDPNVYSNVSGRVKDVMVTPGEEVGSSDIAVSVEQMDPISIKVKCPVELLNLKDKNLTALVYAVGSSRPLACVVTTKENDVSNIYLNVPNKTILTKQLTSRQKKLPKVFSVYPVRNLLNNDILPFSKSSDSVKNSEILVLPIKTIRTDSTGTFVYKIKDVNILEKKLDEITKTFVVEKIPVKVNNFSTAVSYGIDDIQKTSWITPLKSLSVGDIIIGESDRKLISGNEAVKVNFYWEFYPGQRVKVKIIGLTPPGIYIPKEAVIHEDSGKDYVYLVENGVAKLEKVNVKGFYNKYCMITGRNIKAGQRVIIINNNELFFYLYDGRRINVVQTVEAPIFMQHEHASDFSRVDVPSKKSVSKSKNKFKISGLGDIVQHL